MSGRTRIVLACVGALAVSAAFFFFFIRPRQGALAETRAQVERAENETVSLQAELDRRKALQANAPALEAELTEFRQLVPDTDEVANFIFLVEQAASQAGVGFVTITPELPKPPPETVGAGTPLAEVRTTIDARGDYFSIQDFFRRLYELDRATRVDLVTMTAGAAEAGAPAEAAGAASDITLNMTARIFFEPPEGAINAAGATTSPAVPTAGTTTSP